MTQGLLKSFLFTVVGENWNLRGISYSMSYPYNGSCQKYASSETQGL